MYSVAMASPDGGLAMTEGAVGGIVAGIERVDRGRMGGLAWEELGGSSANDVARVSREVVGRR